MFTPASASPRKHLPSAGLIGDDDCVLFLLLAWVSPRIEAPDYDAGAMSRPTPILFFSIGGLADFAFGLIKWHSIIAGLVAVVCGFPLTALLFLFFRNTRDEASTAPK